MFGTYKQLATQVSSTEALQQEGCGFRFLLAWRFYVLPACAPACARLGSLAPFHSPKT